MLFLKIFYHLIHGIIQMILLRGRMNSNNGMLFMLAGRVTVDDVPSSCRSCPILHL
jgi:hypothetical protein